MEAYMSVKKNILTISCFILLLPGSPKAMDSDRESQNSSFTNIRQPTRAKSGLRLSANREVKPPSQEDILKKNLKNAQNKFELEELNEAQKFADLQKKDSLENQKAYSEAKEELDKSRKLRNELREELKKLKKDTLITTETKSN
jgi:hypothetical protein